MAGREERLSSATRNYVIFGLLFVIAVGLAVRDWLDPRERRGEADSGLRLLIVSDDPGKLAAAMTEIDGFYTTQVDADEVVAEGRDLIDEDEPAHRAAIAYADQRGYGFVAIDLRAAPGAEPGSWGLDTLDDAPTEATPFALFSVGDLAPEGPRMRSVEPAPGIEYEGVLAELDSLRLALYDHPDLLRLWAIEPNATQLQARQVLDSRDIDGRRELLKRDQAAWRELAGAWPASGTIAGSLTGPWERVQAAPIPGGLLLEVRRQRLHVSAFRRVSVETEAEAELHFLPYAALGADEPDPVRDRRHCEGLPERLEAELAVAPDGSALVVQRSMGVTEVLVFERDLGAGECRARSAGFLTLGARAIGRPNAAGAMAWSYDDDWLRWWDQLGEHRERVSGIDGFSGPWWVDEELLAMVGERTNTDPAGEADELASHRLERALVLLGAGDARDRLELGARELFAELIASEGLGPESEATSLLDLRPVGADELLISTERCVGEAREDRRPCVHRLRASEPLGRVLRRVAAGELAASELIEAGLIAVETLGPIGPYVELAIAPDGSRAAWIDGYERRRLMVADLRGPKRLVPRRVDADALADASPRVSATISFGTARGTIVLSEAEVEIAAGELEAGTVRIARAFVLDPPEPEPEPTEQL